MKIRTHLGVIAALLAALAPLSTGPARAETFVINVVDGATTEPATLTITAGDSVVFLNKGVLPHNPTAQNGSFALPPLKPGESATVSFPVPGTVPFLCTLHTAQRGTIIVLPAPVVEPEPQVEPAPAAEPDPISEPAPAVEPAPVAEPEPLAEPASATDSSMATESVFDAEAAAPPPVVEPTPAVKPSATTVPAPVAEPAPSTEPAVAKEERWDPGAAEPTPSGGSAIPGEPAVEQQDAAVSGPLISGAGPLKAFLESLQAN